MVDDLNKVQRKSDRDKTPPTYFFWDEDDLSDIIICGMAEALVSAVLAVSIKGIGGGQRKCKTWLALQLAEITSGVAFQPMVKVQQSQRH